MAVSEIVTCDVHGEPLPAGAPYVLAFLDLPAKGRKAAHVCLGCCPAPLLEYFKITRDGAPIVESEAK